jgi:hypothetical protein
MPVRLIYQYLLFWGVMDLKRGLNILRRIGEWYSSFNSIPDDFVGKAHPV